MPLVDRVANRRLTAADPAEVGVGDTSPVHQDTDLLDVAQAAMQSPSVFLSMPLNATQGFVRGAAAGTTPLEMLEGGLAGAGIAVVASAMGSRGGVVLLRQVSELLDEHVEKEQLKKGDFQAHGLLAKDQPGHEDDARGVLKTKKFELAHALSTEADRMIIGQMRQVLDAPDSDAANAKLEEVYAMLDRLIGSPGPGHPLDSVIATHRAEAEAALKEFLRQREVEAAAAKG